MILIDDEVKHRIKQPINLDNMAERFITSDETFAFTSPSLKIYERNRYYLLKNSVRKSFNPKYFMRPDYLSFDEYGTVALSTLLMYINGVFCIEEFELSNVVIPSFNAVIEIIGDKYPELDNSKLQRVNW